MMADEKALADVPLTLNKDFAGKIFDARPRHCMAKSDRDNAISGLMLGADWQRQRMVEDLEERLTTILERIKGLDNNPGNPAQLITTRVAIRARYEGEKDLLQSLIAKLS